CVVVEVFALQPALDLAVRGERELLGGDDRVLGTRAPWARLIPHGAGRAESLADSVDDRHRMEARARVAPEACVRGVGTDYGERARRAGEGQCRRGVLEQHD